MPIPKALEMYAEKVKQPVDILQESLQGLSSEIRDADRPDGRSRRRGDGRREAEVLDSPLTKEQLAEFLQIIRRVGSVTGFQMPVLRRPSRSHRSDSRAPPSRFAARTASALPSSPISRWRATVASVISGVDAKLAQRGGDLLHLVGAADAVARHAFEVVVDHLLPIERRVIVRAARPRPRRAMPARCAAMKHSAVSASMPLIITLRIIFSAAAAPTSSGRDRAAHVEFVDQQRHHGLRMRPREQQRGLVALGMDRREDRDIDVARRIAEQPARLPSCGRARRS